MKCIFNEHACERREKKKSFLSIYVNGASLSSTLCSNFEPGAVLACTSCVSLTVRHGRIENKKEIINQIDKYLICLLVRILLDMIHYVIFFFISFSFCLCAPSHRPPPLSMPLCSTIEYNLPLVLFVSFNFFFIFACSFTYHQMA